jgi:hypothetical protein
LNGAETFSLDVSLSPECLAAGCDLCVDADADNVVKESNEENNQRCASFEGLPDLSVAVDPPVTRCSPEGACSSSARVTVRNLGPTRALPFATRANFDPGQSVSVLHVFDSELVAQGVATFELRTPQGESCADPECSVCVDVDILNGVAEADAGNNHACNTGAPLADLRVSTIYSPGEACVGGVCTESVTLDLTNAGLGDAGNFSVELNFPNQSVSANVFVPLVRAGETLQLAPISVVTGSTGCFVPDCVVCATVDSTDVVPESDESSSSNSLCRPFLG